MIASAINSRRTERASPTQVESGLLTIHDSRLAIHDCDSMHFKKIHKFASERPFELRLETDLSRDTERQCPDSHLEKRITDQNDWRVALDKSLRRRSEVLRRSLVFESHLTDAEGRTCEREVGHPRTSECEQRRQRDLILSSATLRIVLSRTHRKLLVLIRDCVARSLALGLHSFRPSTRCSRQQESRVSVSNTSACCFMRKQANV